MITNCLVLFKKLLAKNRAERNNPGYNECGSDLSEKVIPLNLPCKNSKQLAVCIEVLRRRDIKFDGELRQYLFTTIPESELIKQLSAD